MTSLENKETEERINQMLTPVGCSLDEVLALEDLRTRGRTSCVFLGGSLAESMGNAGSDVDMYVIGSNGPAAPNYHRIEQVPVAVHMLGERRVAFTYLTPQKIQGVASRLIALNFVERGTDNIPLEYRLSEEEGILAHRLRTGAAVWNEQQLERLHALFDFESLARYQMVLSIRAMWHMMEDLEGMTAADDRDVAIAMSRELLDNTVDAYLHDLGNTNIRRKWRLKLLSRAPLTDLSESVIDRYWRLAYPNAARLRGDREQLVAHSRACLNFAKEITRWIDARYTAAA